MRTEVHIPAATAGGNHLTTEVGGAKRETYSRHRRHHARARSLATLLHLTERTFDLQQCNRRVEVSGRLVRLVNSHSPEHQKGEIASAIIPERLAVKSLATSEKHSSWSPICE